MPASRQPAQAQNVTAILDQTLARSIVNDGIHRYIASRRAKVDAFVEHTFSLRGAWEVNRKGVGRDIVRAPLNTLMIAPTLALEGAAHVARKSGRTEMAKHLSGRNLFLKTDVGRELEWRLFSEFFELPFADKKSGRDFTGDALAQEILKDPRLIKQIQPFVMDAAAEAAKPGGRAWLDETVTAYMGTRAAATELSTLVMCMGTGAALTQQLTPGLISLGPAVAKSLEASLAAHGFAGTATASVPTATAMAAGGTVALVFAASCVTAISGAVTDPLQRALGLHHKRLHQMLDLMEEAFIMGDRAPFVVADQYVGRVMDLADVSLALWHARPI